tara:strand:+ start:453 stop:4841 length:4389 start_codon:yes stop_codon:yes gene_type:complete
MTADPRCYGGSYSPQIPQLQPNALDAANPRDVTQYIPSDPRQAAGTLQPSDPIIGADGRCYGPFRQESLQPNPLDASNPVRITLATPPPPPSSGVPTYDDPADNPANRCYGPIPIPNSPERGTSPDLPTPPPLPPSDEDIDPREVIRQLVGRCYPPLGLDDGGIRQPDIDLPPFDIPDLRVDPPIDMICEMFPYLPFCPECEKYATDPSTCVEFPIKIPTPGPGILPPTIGGGGKDCDKIWELQRDNLVKDIGDGYWERTDTREQFYCPPEQKNDDWGKCVEEALECLFKPYIDGAWQPPSQDCVTFYPRGYNGNIKSFCIANCYPDRVGIYEYVTQKGAALAFKPYGSGLHNLLGVTTNYDGSWNGSKIDNPGGNKIYTSAGNRTYSASLGSANITVNVEVYNDNGEFDTRWYCTYTGDLPAVGTETTASFTGDSASFDVTFMVLEGNKAGTNHDYGTSSTPPTGYTLTSNQPVFYLHKNKKDDRSVAVYKYYSNSRKDTLLTIKPGEPDTPGNGERATLNAGGYGFVEILGWAYEDAAAMNPYLGKKEKAQELHRYYDKLFSTAEVKFSGQSITVSGNCDFTIEWSWKDSPNIAGVTCDSFTIDNKTFERRGTRGSQTERFTNMSAGTYPITFQNLHSANSNFADRIYNDNESVCLLDGHGDDCNGTIRISRVDKASTGNIEMDNHFYSIRKQTIEEPPTKDSNKNYYLIPNDVNNTILMNIDVEKGRAGYRNTLMAYIETDGVPRWAQLLVVDATNEAGMTQHMIPINILQQYKGGNLGFLLVSNGAQLNSYNVGDTFTNFSQLSDGWRIDGVSSSESNYVLFSDESLNPEGSVSDSRDYTVWKGDHWQWWEDLISGDSDFDDCKFWHEVVWAGGATAYEGIECYVWREDKPPSITKPLLSKSDCDPRLFKKSFKDVLLMRNDCGSEIIDVTGDSGDISCGKCNGEYLFQVNRTQKSKIVTKGKFSLRSLGGITQGLAGDCMVFILKLWKNNNVIWEQKFRAGAWPEIGQKLHDDDYFEVVEGDVIKFKVTEIKRGPTSGQITPRLGILDEDNYLFESTFNLRLQTQPGDARSIPYPSTINPEAESSKGVGGEITGFDMCYMHNLDDRGKNSEIEDWQRYYTVWENQQPVNMDANNQIHDHDDYPRYTHWTADQGGSNNRAAMSFRGWDGSDRNAYIDTYGFKEKDKGQHYNQLVTRMLFKDGKTGPIYLDGTGAPTAVKRHVQSETHYARLAKYSDDGFSWWDTKMNSFVATSDLQWMLDNLYDGMQQNPEVLTNYEMGYFIQDYWLIPEDDDNVEDHGIGANTAKIRVGITFWAKNEGYSNKAGPKRITNFYATIELLEVLDWGDGYGEGQEFEFYWPPKYTDRIMDYSTDNNVAPFSPTIAAHRSSAPNYNPLTKDIPSEIKIGYEPSGRGYRDTKRPVYDAFYQESHNKESMYWFIDKKEYRDRVRFKIRVNGVQ